MSSMDGPHPDLAAMSLEPPAETPLTGLVLAGQANYYQVRLDIPIGFSYPTPMLLCTRRSRLKKLGQQVMVGDRVVVEEPDWAGGRGAIAQVLPRDSELDRPPVANANQILLVFAVEQPTLDPLQLSRFLVKAESTGLEVCLCLNKVDLIPETIQRDWRSRLTQWGYAPILISVQQQTGIAELADHLRQQITIVSGPSGVGKSSLINALIPQVQLRVGAVSGKLERGRHTTRHVELFELPDGGLLADTPGFNQPELDCLPAEVGDLFPEVLTRGKIHPCQFGDCLHRDEPNCGVRGDWERYDHYLMVLDEAITYQQAIARSANDEGNLKVKTKTRGHRTYEPKLDQRYRRVSRRSELQAWQRDLESLSPD